MSAINHPHQASPSNSASGHVSEVQQEELGGLVGHVLRHLYATFALEAGVPLAELCFLLNHSASSGGVTMGYLHPSIDYLGAWQEKASARVMGSLGLSRKEGMWPPSEQVGSEVVCLGAALAA